MWAVVCKTFLLSLVTVSDSFARVCVFLLQLQPVSNNFDLCGKKSRVCLCFALLRLNVISLIIVQRCGESAGFVWLIIKEKYLLLQHYHSLLHWFLNIHLKPNWTDLFLSVVSELTVLLTIKVSSWLPSSSLYSTLQAPPFKNSCVCWFYKSFFLLCDCWRVFWSVSHACPSAVCNNLKTLLWAGSHRVTCKVGPDKIQWAQ